MKKIILSLLLAVPGHSWAGVVETVGVNGMVCSFCAQGITKKFKELPEVEAVDVSLENKRVQLTYKDGQKLTREKIANILKEAGYEARFDK